MQMQPIPQTMHRPAAPQFGRFIDEQRELPVFRQLVRDSFGEAAAQNIDPRLVTVNAVPGRNPLSLMRFLASFNKDGVQVALRAADSPLPEVNIYHWFQGKTIEQAQDFLKRMSQGALAKANMQIRQATSDPTQIIVRQVVK